MSLGLRHFIRREKARQGIEPPKRTPLLAMALDLLIYPIAIASPLALIPQAWALYSTHNASGLSLSTWTILGLLNLAWIAYGQLHHERPVVLTNVALAILNFAIALGILLYQ